MMSNSNSPASNEVHELVLLMEEPLIVDAGFLRSAYHDFLGLKLDTETEFVIGQFPFFMFQTAGVLVSVTMGDPF